VKLTPTFPAQGGKRAAGSHRERAARPEKSRRYKHGAGIAETANRSGARTRGFSVTDSARESIASREKAGYARVTTKQSSPVGSISFFSFSIFRPRVTSLSSSQPIDRSDYNSRFASQSERLGKRDDVSRVRVNCDLRQSVASAVYDRLIPVNDFPRPHSTAKASSVCSFKFRSSNSNGGCERETRARETRSKFKTRTTQDIARRRGRRDRYVGNFARLIGTISNRSK